VKGLKIISLLVCTGFLFVAVAGQVTLQNGINGYMGCEDSYLRSESSSSEYGSSTDLRTKYELCSS
jgi:hypothetical protein